MSRRDDRVSLMDMRNYAVEAVDLTEGKSLNDLFEDRIRQLALLKLVETVGEAANRVSDKTKQNHSTIPWPQIVGVRNRLGAAVADDRSRTVEHHPDAYCEEGTSDPCPSHRSE